MKQPQRRKGVKVQTKTYTTETGAKKAAASRRHVMYRTVEDGRTLLRAAQEIHAERHGAQTFTSGTHLPLQAAGARTGLSPNRLRYYDAVQELEYEGAIEWDPSARYARGDKHYVVTQRGLDGAG
jgi:hypothetical protein